MEIDCIFARALSPPSAMTAAATEPLSLTRGERCWELLRGKWVIVAGLTMTLTWGKGQITKARVHERMLRDTTYQVSEV